MLVMFLTIFDLLPALSPSYVAPVQAPLLLQPALDLPFRGVSQVGSAARSADGLVRGAQVDLDRAARVTPICQD